MKLLFIIDSKKYKMHMNITKEFISLLEREVKFSIVDMSKTALSHEIFNEIVSYGADLVITLDFAGMELRTETEDPSLNLLHSRVIHMLFDKPNKYSCGINDYLNLSHYVFVPRGTDLLSVINKYKNLPNIMEMPEWIKEQINEWFNEICEEMMLV